MEHTVAQCVADLQKLGIGQGNAVFMHSSYKSLGGIENGPAGLFTALETALGAEGTLILPAFSYDTVSFDQPDFFVESTPSCVGFLPEYFRKTGVRRSLHATHSCCAKGAKAGELLAEHELDLTPVGSHSPIAKLPKIGGKILFLGCSADHNTAMHGVEELVVPPYVFDRKRKANYILHAGNRVIRQEAIHHGFTLDGYFYGQKYSRLLPLLSPEECRYGKVLDADCALLSAEAVWRVGKAKMQENPLYFVDKIPLQTE